jgi:hypothetical protein
VHNFQENLENLSLSLPISLYRCNHENLAEIYMTYSIAKTCMWKQKKVDIFVYAQVIVQNLGRRKGVVLPIHDNMCMYFAKVTHGKTKRVTTLIVKKLPST